MKNIEIRIIKDGTELYKYISDIIPNVGDMIEIPKMDENQKILECAGTYCITDRTFLTSNNRIKLHVDSIML